MKLGETILSVRGHQKIIKVVIIKPIKITRNSAKFIETIKVYSKKLVNNISFHTVNNRFTLRLHYILLCTIKSKFRLNDPSEEARLLLFALSKKALIHPQIFFSNPQESGKKMQIR